MLYAIGKRYGVTESTKSASGKPGDVTSITTILSRTIDSAPVVGVSITYSVGGTVIGSATTDSTGKAVLAYTVPQNAAIGTTKYVASFAATGPYAAAASSNNLKISQHSVQIATKNVPGSLGQTISLTGTFTRDDGTSLANAAVTFSVDGAAIGTTTTDTNGVATISYTIPSGSKTGKHPFTITYSGDTADRAASGGSNINVTK
jgi:hypothetical protein